MNAPGSDQGIALACDAEGAVLRIISDGLGLCGRIPPGSPVTALVDAASADKMRNFLAEARAKQVVFNWEITVPVADDLKRLHFSAWSDGPELTVVAAQSSDELDELTGELMRINNEQANTLRATVKDLAMQSARDDSIYEELMRVNNDLANLQREMVRKNAALTKLNEEKNRLLGMAAHDLRNPLGVIQTFSSFLESEAAPSLGEEHREFITTIRETCEFMLRMVGDLLDVSAIESGLLKLDIKSCDLAGLIAHNVALNRTLAARKQIAITFDRPEKFPHIRLDPEKITQVLNNLIGNAVKFSHSGTTIDVLLEMDGGSARVNVRDQGQGIPESELKKLFKPFSTASVRGTAGETSTGLGLAIVGKIIEGHGGTIGVESAPGQGSSFWFTLPCPEAA